MQRRPLLVTLAAGAALTVTGCNGKKNELPEGNSPEQIQTPDGEPATGVDGTDGGAPTPPPPPVTANPPPPDMDRIPPLVGDGSARERLALFQSGLPTWDDVKSPHPEGATNPPSPVLLVTPDGRCFKSWEGGMIPPGPDRVEAVTTPATGTTQINCPTDRAQGVYDAWVDAGMPEKK